MCGGKRVARGAKNERVKINGMEVQLIKFSTFKNSKLLTNFEKAETIIDSSFDF